MVRLILNFLLAGHLLLGYSTPSDAKNYKFRDENGKLHFTNDPTIVPEKYRKDSSKKAAYPVKENIPHYTRRAIITRFLKLNC
jgi:hypothetical protein